jgi:prepilin-type N-terminal cleavage/methylation domain-containing protein
MTRTTDTRGFSLVELMVVVAIMATVAATAVLLTPEFRRQARAESGVLQAMNAIRLAREIAVSQRRNVRLVFVAPNRIQIVREDINAAGVVVGTTQMSTVTLEGAIDFRQFPGQGDTGDAFGMAGPIAFGPSATRLFTSEGSFVTAAGQPLNGTLFLGRINEPKSARAITIFGPTALIKAWRWDGVKWVE